MEKRKNIYIGIFIIVILGISSYAIYLNIKIKDLKEQLKLKENVKITDNQVNNSQNQTEENNTKEIEKIVKEGILVPFDSNKNIEKNDKKYILLKKGVFGCDIVNDSNGKVYININSEEKEYYKLIEAKVPFHENIEVKGLSKKVIDSFIGIHGNGVQYPLVFFLMEDGTVEYLDSKYSFTNNDFKSAGKIPGIENIVRIEQTSVSNNLEGGGWPSIIAINKEGYFYDIGEITKK